MNQPALDGTSSRTTTSTPSDTKMPPSVKGSHWLVGSLGEEGCRWVEGSGKHGLRTSSCWPRSCACSALRWVGAAPARAPGSGSEEQNPYSSHLPFRPGLGPAFQQKGKMAPAGSGTICHLPASRWLGEAPQPGWAHGHPPPDSKKVPSLAPSAAPCAGRTLRSRCQHIPPRGRAGLTRSSEEPVLLTRKDKKHRTFTHIRIGDALGLV